MSTSSTKSTTPASSPPAAIAAAGVGDRTSGVAGIGNRTSGVADIGDRTSGVSGDRTSRLRDPLVPTKYKRLRLALGKVRESSENNLRAPPANSGSKWLLLRSWVTTVSAHPLLLRW